VVGVVVGVRGRIRAPVSKARTLRKSLESAIKTKIAPNCLIRLARRTRSGTLEASKATKTPRQVSRHLILKNYDYRSLQSRFYIAYLSRWVV
jgi:hypothetical protein